MLRGANKAHGCSIEWAYPPLFPKYRRLQIEHRVVERCDHHCNADFVDEELYIHTFVNHTTFQHIMSSIINNFNSTNMVEIVLNCGK